MEIQVIKCFQHCDKTKNVLCFVVPLACPLCKADLTKTHLRIPPYVVDSPFTNASSTCCSLVIKPTRGHFLVDFNNSSDLHIGLTDSSGSVYEFDERGIVFGGKNWEHCLNVDIFSTDDDLELSNDWDTTLADFIKQDQWRKECYCESSKNCYDFVLEFLKYFGLEKHFNCLSDRQHFCEQMIVPLTLKAAKYISLYREIVELGVVINSVS